MDWLKGTIDVPWYMALGFASAIWIIWFFAGKMWNKWWAWVLLLASVGWLVLWFWVLQ